MKKYGFVLIILGICASTFNSAAKQSNLDYVSKAFHDGAYIPNAYKESDVIHRYGEGKKMLNSAGLIQRTYRDAATGMQVVITSNPDVAPKFRTIDEIRISSGHTDKTVPRTIESLKGLKLKGVAIGESYSKAIKASQDYGTIDTSKEKIGGHEFERICGFSEGGSNICFLSDGNKVTAMSVGFGP
ncbi:hypothetical protein [Xanthomonas sp. D-109]|uniref:hypothetical protein n=1 Tax=Xanthomonas sp. D-109 TaxID=2821274 RepID=UPI001ADCAD0B|nr:hypothetical protein [Xanthomonas sp. D-109]MBO9882527.1 hypothetical protein [Xanthomonas sp. D-109]